MTNIFKKDSKTVIVVEDDEELLRKIAKVIKQHLYESGNTPKAVSKSVCFKDEPFKNMTPLKVYEEQGIKGLGIMYQIIPSITDSVLVEQAIQVCKRSLLVEIEKLPPSDAIDQNRFASFINEFKPFISEALLAIAASKGYKSLKTLIEKEGTTSLRQIYEALVYNITVRCKQ